MFFPFPVLEPTPTSVSIENVFLGDDQAQVIEGFGSSQDFEIIPQICGDLNYDGTVNVLDAIVQSKFVAGEIAPKATEL